MKFSQFAIAIAIAGCSLAATGNIQAQDAAKTSVVDIKQVEKAPAFPGGPEALAVYLKEKVAYPAACRQSNARGTITVGFTVNADGTLADVTYLGHPETDNRLIKEGLRVVSAMPQWEPATKNGEKVACKTEVSIFMQP